MRKMPASASASMVSSCSRRFSSVQAAFARSTGTRSLARRTSSARVGTLALSTMFSSSLPPRVAGASHPLPDARAGVDRNVRVGTRRRARCPESLDYQRLRHRGEHRGRSVPAHAVSSSAAQRSQLQVRRLGTNVLNRRKLLALGGVAAGGMVAGPYALWTTLDASAAEQPHAHGTGSTGPAVTPTYTPFTLKMPGPPVLAPSVRRSTVDVYRVPIRVANTEILPGVR